MKKSSWFGRIRIAASSIFRSKPAEQEQDPQPEASVEAPRRKRRPQSCSWTDEEVNYLRIYYPRKKNAELATDLKRSEKAIFKKAQRLGLKKESLFFRMTGYNGSAKKKLKKAKGTHGTD